MPPKSNPLANSGLFRLLNATGEAVNNRPLNTSVRINNGKPQLNSVYPDSATAFKSKAAGSAIASAGGPIAQELANAYMFRVPNYLNALRQPGLNNKVNALQGALMVEGAGAITDLGTKALLAIIAAEAPATAPALPVTIPVANFAKDYASGMTIDPIIMQWAQQKGVGNYLPKSWSNPNNSFDKWLTNKAEGGYQNHPFTKYVTPAMKNADASSLGAAVGNTYNAIKSVFPNQPVKKDRPFVGHNFTP